MKIFGWYIATEPIREIKSLYRVIRRLLASLNKLVTIAYVSLILAVISVYTQKKLLAATLFCLLFFVVLFSEWQSGAFIARHREAVREKLRKEMEKNPEKAYIDDKKREEGKLIGGR